MKKIVMRLLGICLLPIIAPIGILEFIFTGRMNMTDSFMGAFFEIN